MYIGRFVLHKLEWGSTPETWIFPQSVTAGLSHKQPVE